mmetsp:Transcript_34227/g.107212  ORF Transcript_34227/g.107212 Transcript_34227/m.107212 type:complete len:99 (+) Transcript_34227:278-574(+)
MFRGRNSNLSEHQLIACSLSTESLDRERGLQMTTSPMYKNNKYGLNNGTFNKFEGLYNVRKVTDQNLCNELCCTGRAVHHIGTIQKTTKKQRELKECF